MQRWARSCPFVHYRFLGRRLPLVTFGIPPRPRARISRPTTRLDLHLSTLNECLLRRLPTNLFIPTVKSPGKENRHVSAYCSQTASFIVLSASLIMVTARRLTTRRPSNSKPRSALWRNPIQYLTFWKNAPIQCLQLTVMVLTLK